MILCSLLSWGLQGITALPNPQLIYLVVYVNKFSTANAGIESGAPFSKTLDPPLPLSLSWLTPIVNDPLSVLDLKILKK